MRLLFTTLVMLYLTLDFGDPLLPGANSFNVEDSVKGIQVQRDPAPSPPPLAVGPEPLLRLAPVRMSPQRPSHHLRRVARLTPVSVPVVRHLALDPSVPEEA